MFLSFNLLFESLYIVVTSTEANLFFERLSNIFLKNKSTTCAQQQKK